LENISETYKIIIGLFATGLLIIPIALLFIKNTKKRKNIIVDKIAMSIHKMYQNLIITDFDLFPVDSTKYKTLDLLFYEAIRTYLEKNNFCLVGDFEESNFKNKFPNIPYFSRIMISEDDSIKAIIYHLKIGETSFKTIEFVTEFTNGNFIITSNNFLNSQIEYPKEIEFKFFKTNSIQELLENHINNKQQIIESKNTVTQSLKGISGIIEQNKREKAKTNYYRNLIGKDDIIKELKRLCPNTVDNQTILNIADRIIELRTLEKKN